jgi:hypothetical protein
MPAVDAASVFCWTISSYAFSPLVVTIRNKEKKNGREVRRLDSPFFCPCLEFPMPLLLEGF